MTPPADLATITAWLLTVLALGLGSRSTSTTLGSAHTTGLLESRPAHNSSGDVPLPGGPHTPGGPRAPGPGESRAQNGPRAPGPVGPHAPGTTLDPHHVNDSGSTRSTDVELEHQKVRRRKNSRKKQRRMLDLSEDTCLKWSPKLNLTLDPNRGMIVVDYCQSGNLPIPATHTCVTQPDFALCTVVEQPQCWHNFENLTSGNYTILVRPLCKTCFNAVVFKKKCITPVFQTSVLLGSDHTSLTCVYAENDTDNQENTTLMMRVDISRSKDDISRDDISRDDISGSRDDIFRSSDDISRDDISGSRDNHVAVIVAGSTGTVILILAVLLVASILKRRSKRASATSTAASSPPSPHNSNTSLPTRARETSPTRARETCPRRNQQQTAREALLGSCQRQAQVAAELEPLSPRLNYHVGSNTGQRELCSSVVTLGSNTGQRELCSSVVTLDSNDEVSAGIYIQRNTSETSFSNTCDNNTCVDSQTWDNDRCVDSQTWDNDTCVDSQTCDNDICVDSQTCDNDICVDSQTRDNDRCVDSQTHPHESQDNMETLRDYFSTFTGLRLESSDMRAPPRPTIAIPYNLIYSSGAAFNQGLGYVPRSANQRGQAGMFTSTTGRAGSSLLTDKVDKLL